MADYSYYVPCRNKCGEEVSYTQGNLCWSCRKKEDEAKELARLRPYIIEVLKENGLLE